MTYVTILQVREGYRGGCWAGNTRTKFPVSKLMIFKDDKSETVL